MVKEVNELHFAFYLIKKLRETFEEYKIFSKNPSFLRAENKFEPVRIFEYLVPKEYKPVMGFLSILGAMPLNDAIDFAASYLKAYLNERYGNKLLKDVLNEISKDFLVVE